MGTSLTREAKRRREDCLDWEENQRNQTTTVEKRVADTILGAMLCINLALAAVDVVHRGQFDTENAVQATAKQPEDTSNETEELEKENTPSDVLVNDTTEK